MRANFFFQITYSAVEFTYRAAKAKSLHNAEEPGNNHTNEQSRKDEHVNRRVDIFHVIIFYGYDFRIQMGKSNDKKSEHYGQN